MPMHIRLFESKEFPVSTYLHELGNCYAAMTKKVRATFVVLALLPGLLLLPMCWYMTTNNDAMAATLQLAQSAAAGVKVDEKTLSGMVKNAFSDSQAKNVFVCSVVAIFLITNLLFMKTKIIASERLV